MNQNVRHRGAADEDKYCATKEKENTALMSLVVAARGASIFPYYVELHITGRTCPYTCHAQFVITMASLDPSEIEKFFLVEDPNDTGLSQDLVNAGAVNPVVPDFIVPVSPNNVAAEQGLVQYLNDDIDIALELYPHIDNVICSFLLKHDIDLKAVAFRARNAEYNPRKVNAVVVRFRSPRSTALIYSNGKVMVTGSRSEEDARTACKKVAVIVNKCNHPNVRFADFKIENIVASTDVRYPVRLEGLAYEHRASCSYEPELFPGLVYRLLEPKISLLIFVSGKVVITGGRNRQDIITAFKSIYPVLHKYRK